MSHTETTTPKTEPSEALQQIEKDLKKLIKNKNEGEVKAQISHDSRIIRWHFYALNDFERTMCFFLGFILSTLVAMIYSAYIAQGSLWSEFSFVFIITLAIVYGTGFVLLVIHLSSGPSSESRIKKLLDKNLSTETKAFISNEIAIYQSKMQAALALKASHPAEYDDALIKALDEDYRTQLERNLILYGRKIIISIG